MLCPVCGSEQFDGRFCKLCGYRTIGQPINNILSLKEELI